VASIIIYFHLHLSIIVKHLVGDVWIMVATFGRSFVIQVYYWLRLQVLHKLSFEFTEYFVISLWAPFPTFPFTSLQLLFVWWLLPPLLFILLYLLLQLLTYVFWILRPWLFVFAPISFIFPFVCYSPVQFSFVINDLFVYSNGQ